MHKFEIIRTFKPPRRIYPSVLNCFLASTVSSTTPSYVIATNAFLRGRNTSLHLFLILKAGHKVSDITNPARAFSVET